MEPQPPPPPPPPPPSQPPFAGQPVQTTTWFQRNKAWAIPVGCIVLIIVLTCCGLIGAAVAGGGKLFSFIGDAMKGQQEMQALVQQRVSADARVTEVLGSPVTVTNLHSPQYNYENGRVSFRFEMDANGPKGHAAIHAHATKITAKASWHFDELELEPDKGEAIDLTEVQE